MILLCSITTLAACQMLHFHIRQTFYRHVRRARLYLIIFYHYHIMTFFFFSTTMRLIPLQMLQMAGNKYYNSMTDQFQTGNQINRTGRVYGTHMIWYNNNIQSVDEPLRQWCDSKRYGFPMKFPALDKNLGISKIVSCSQQS